MEQRRPVRCHVICCCLVTPFLRMSFVIHETTDAWSCTGNLQQFLVLQWVAPIIRGYYFAWDGGRYVHSPLT